MSESSNDRHVKNERALNVTPYVIFFLLGICVLLAVSFVIRSHAEITLPPVYASDAKTGSVTKLYALPYNRQSGLAMVNFAAQNITFCLNIDFSSYQDVTQECRRTAFSEAGYVAFERALNKQGVLEKVRDGNAIVRSVVDGMPTLAEPGQLGNELVYTVEVPIVLDVKQLGRENKPSRQVAIVMLARDNKPDTFDHFRIVRVDIEPRS